MTTAQIQTEVAKLNASQRASLRNTIGCGTIEGLTVTQRGWYTQVEARMYGYRHFVKIGPRGKVMQREVA